MTTSAGDFHAPHARPLPHVATEDHGGLLAYRLWHPTNRAPNVSQLRTWGPLFRFDPHTSSAAAPGEDPAGRGVWYAGEMFETAVREVFDRHRRPAAGHTPQVGVCVFTRATAVRLPEPCELLDLTVAAGSIGAPLDIGDNLDTDYTVTRAWARAIHDDLAPAGLRYYSARHRDVDGGRVGINLARWKVLDVPAVEVVSDVGITQAGAWRRLMTILDRVGVALERLEGCHRCTQ